MPVIRYALLFLTVLTGLWYCSNSDSSRTRVSYWLWAGLTARDAPPNSELYVFQGTIRTDSSNSEYEREGLFPHPIECRSLFLVYRLEGELPTAETILDLFEKSVARWQRHPVTVDGIQLDFDSPTARLGTYTHFLQRVRRTLPPEYMLSITGLGDWVMSGDPEAMRTISSVTDEIVVQLYQGRQPLGDIENYLARLADYSQPFRIGLLHGFEPPRSLDRLRANPNFRGIIYFIVREA